jgi:hypothetical protein
MIKKLDEYHKKILDFLKKNNWGKNIGLRKIAEYATLNHPQKALNKLNQLERMWYIRKNYEDGKYNIFKNPIPEFMIIPVYSSEQFGKQWFIVPQTAPIRKIKMSSYILWISGNGKYLLIKVTWKSLLPAIKPNDIVLVKKRKATYERKKIFNNSQ